MQNAEREQENERPSRQRANKKPVAPRHIFSSRDFVDQICISHLKNSVKTNASNTFWPSNYIKKNTHFPLSFEYLINKSLPCPRSGIMHL